MTKDQFVERFRRHTAGVIALGSADVHRIHGGPFKSVESYGHVLTTVNDEAVKLLGQLYDALQPKPALDGQAPTQVKK